MPESDSRIYAKELKNFEASVRMYIDIHSVSDGDVYCLYAYVNSFAAVCDLQWACHFVYCIRG